MFSSFTQERILSERVGDQDYMHETQSALAESDEYRLFLYTLVFCYIEFQVVSVCFIGGTPHLVQLPQVMMLVYRLLKTLTQQLGM